MSDVIVQFAHGLESGPQGTKVSHLTEAGFSVRAPDMQMSVRNMKKTNAVARNLLRLPEVGALGAAVAVSAGVAAAKRDARPLWLGLGVGVGLAAMRYPAWRGQAMRRSFEACVAIQAEALEQYGPDVLLGSSWGGAVVLELVRRGVWSGPTIVLAPAYASVGRWANLPGLGARIDDIRRRSERVPIVVFHDPGDDVVPYKDSLELVRGSSMELRTVSAGGHRLLGLLENGSLAECIEGISKAR